MSNADLKIPESAVISRLYLYKPVPLPKTIKWLNAITTICPDARLMRGEGPLVMAAFDPARVPGWKEEGGDE